MAIVSSSEITITDLSDGIAFRSDPPANPSVGLSYLDSTTSPATLKTWNGTAWVNGTLALSNSDPSSYQAIGTAQSTANNANTDINNMQQIDLNVWARHYINSPTLVTDPNDKAYSVIIGFTNMDQVVGGAFNGTLQSNDLLQGGIDTPSTAWALINMVKLYKLYGKQEYLTNVNLIANYFVNHLIDCTYYGSAFKAMPDEYTFNWTNMNWESKTSIIHIRSFYHTIWALLEAYSISPVAAYKTAAQELLDGVAIFTENIKARIADNEILPYMVGTQYNAITSTDGSAFVQDMTNSFNLTSLDVIVKSVQKFVGLFGNETRTNGEGVSYTVQGIMDDAVNHVLTMYNSYGLRRTNGHNLLYCFEHFEWTDTPDSSGRYTAIPMNWDYNSNVWGVDEWFTGDLEFWMIKGLTYSGHTDIASSLMSRYYQLRVSNTADNDLLFYDTMDKNGQPYNGDTSMSISFTGLFLTIENDLGNITYNQSCAQTLKKYQLLSADRVLDGGYPWDVSIPGQMIEGKTLGEIIYSPLEKIALPFNKDGVVSDIINMAYTLNLRGLIINNGARDTLNIDESGNITTYGDIVGGNISGVNFTGNNLNLSGALNVTGSISAANNGVVIDNNGITINKGSIQGTSYHQNVNGQNIWIDGNGFHAQHGSQDIWIAAGKGLEVDYNGSTVFTVTETGLVHTIGNMYAYGLSQSPGERLALYSDQEITCVNVANTANQSIMASAFDVVSVAEAKQDITPMSSSGLSIITNTDIYNFHYISDVKNKRASEKYGVIIGTGYKTPTSLMNYSQDAVDLYNATFINTKGIQELYQKVIADEATIAALQAKIGG